MDLLLQRIELHGFEKSYDPEGDGDCFYKAAAFQLGRDGNELKNEMFDYLANNQYDALGQNRLDFLCSGDIQNQDVPSDWSEAITLLRSNWANEMVIRALSERLQCKITIVTTSGETPDSYIKVILPPEQCELPLHELYFGHTGDHFFALKEKKSHYHEESLASSCSMIFTLNKDKEKVNACVDTLYCYLDNICKSPDEEKYQKIKRSNNIFQKHVAQIKGATEFLLACGFEDKVFSVEDSEESYFVLPKEVCSDRERLEKSRELLVSTAETFKSKLDHDPKHSNEESLISSCSMIYTLNEDKEKVKACVDTLCRYLDNIRKNPEEEKYYKIKQSNTIFQERVAPIKGASEFLLACGFENKVLPVEGSEETFFVFSKEACSDCDRLKVFKEVLISSESKKPGLDRGLKPSPPDFDDKSNAWLQPQAFSTLLNFMLPVEYLIGEMFWWQELNKAKQSDPDQLWSREHMTGSYAEGLCIPRSLLHRSGNNLKGLDYTIVSADRDIMPVNETFVTITDEKIPIFDIVRSGSDPRYVFLRLTEQWKKFNANFSDSFYLQQPFLLAPLIVKKILRAMNLQQSEGLEGIQEGIHGPARKLFIQELESLMSFDTTDVFKYPNSWPESAMNWLIRPRNSGWPSPALVQDIFDSGCHLAPVGRGRRASEPVERADYLTNPGLVTYTGSQQGQEETLMDESEWRISFSLAENKLGLSLSPGQRHIMVLIKIIKKAYFGDHDVISTYLLKNLFFWECENRENDFWREDNSAECLLTVLDRLVECLKKRHLPHFIIPESNLLMNEDPVKLDEAAETVLKVRKNIFQKTLSVLARLQTTMFQSREFFCDFENKLIANEENINLYSFCQLYKEVIVDEHKKDKENVMISEQIVSIINGSLSVLDILDQFISDLDVASLFPQPSSQGILDLFFLNSLFLKLVDDIGNEFKKIYKGFDRLELTIDNLILNDAHLWYTLQELWGFLIEIIVKLIDDSMEGVLKEFFQFIMAKNDFQDETRLVGLLTDCFLLLQKHKEKIFGYIRDFIVQLGNLAKLYSSNISQLRLRVHESLLARAYCKLWFTDNRKSSERNKEAFYIFVREDVKSCPHLDEKFFQLSLTFFDGVIMGRDSFEIIPVTTAMEQVKEIQQSIAHETFKALKILYLLYDKVIMTDGFVESFMQIFKTKMLITG